MSSSLAGPIPFKLIESINETLVQQSPKAALQLCDKFIKKRPTSSHLQAIRAYLLAQTHRETEAETLARSLLQDEKVLKDDLLLSTLARTFSQLGDWERAGQLLSGVFRAQPSPEAGLDLFDVLLRGAELKKAFPVALKLAGLANEQAFLTWALSVCYADRRWGVSREPSWASDDLLERIADKVLANTASRKLQLQDGSEKLTDEKRALLEMQQVEELRLLTDIYQLLPSRRESTARETVRELLETFEAKKASPSDTAVLLQHLLDVGQAEECWRRVSSILREHGIVDWALWRMAAEAASSIPGLDKPQELRRLIGEIEPVTERRSVILARLNIAADAEIVEECKRYIQEYYELHPEGQFITHDVRHLFRASSSTLKDELSAFCILKATESASGSTWRILAQILSPTALTPALAGRNQLLDVINLAASGDRQSLAAASQLLLQEGGLPTDSSPYSYVIVHLVLSLLNGTLYSQPVTRCLSVGDFGTAVGLFKVLDVKMIQMDTLLYLVSDHVFPFAAFLVAEGIFEENFYIYGLTQKEMSDGLMKALQRAQYTLAVEFLRFMKRMDTSLQSLACVAGTIWAKVMKQPVDELALALEPLIGDEEILLDEKGIAQCSDNRDRSIFLDVDPTGKLGELWDGHLQTFKASDYYFRIISALILRQLLGPGQESSASNVKAYCERLLNYTPSFTDPLQRTLISFALYSTLPLVERPQVEEQSAFSNSLSEAIRLIDGELKELPENDTVYKLISHCSMLLQSLRLLCLFATGSFKGAAFGTNKARRSAARRAFAYDLSKLGDLCKRVREYLSKILATESGKPGFDRHGPWLRSITDAVERDCIALLQ